MNPWFAKVVVLAASIMLVVIRAPHGRRSRNIKIATNRRGPLETVVLAAAWVGFLTPLIWLATPWLSFADYSLQPLPFALGVICFVAGLWLFHRSHVDLGTNWSSTLQIREQHRLVTAGVYRAIRHPMYTALFLYSLGQLFVLPNWLAGPSQLVTFTALFALRLPAEEQLMFDEFGAAYRSYQQRTKRIIPGVW